MSDQFCLKWNNHHTTLVTVFDKLFECESMVDCTLAAEGKMMKAHKVVLSACSSYLEEILKLHDDKHPILIFNDISYGELKAMLEYMYRGEVNVSQEQLNTFLKAAEALKIKGLTTDQGGGTASSGDLRRKVGLKDSRSHSPVVGTTPVERPPSPKRKRRRSRDENFPADSNSCDTAPTPPPTNTNVSTPKSEDNKVSSNVKMKKESAESTTPQKLLQPKLEYMDDSKNVEDFSLEEDEEYGPNPGTSQGAFFNQDFNSWAGPDQSNDDVSIGSQHELNNSAGNSQGLPKMIKPFDRLIEERINNAILQNELFPEEIQLKKLERKRIEEELNHRRCVQELEKRQLMINIEKEQLELENLKNVVKK